MSGKKKSSSSIKVPERAPANNSGDDLGRSIRELDETCIDLLRRAADVRTVLRDKTAMESAKNPEVIKNLANVLVKDLTEYKENLDVIRSQWQGKKFGQGEDGQVDPDELMMAIQICESYQHWINSFTLVVNPNIAHLLSEINTGMESASK